MGHRRKNTILIIKILFYENIKKKNKKKLPQITASQPLQHFMYRKHDTFNVTFVRAARDHNGPCEFYRTEYRLLAFHWWRPLTQDPTNLAFLQGPEQIFEHVALYLAFRNKETQH